MPVVRSVLFLAVVPWSIPDGWPLQNENGRKYKRVLGTAADAAVALASPVPLVEIIPV
jgi:hypothetical protein